MDIPQVCNGKLPDEFVNAGIHVLALPADTPFGNLALKHIKILSVVDWINERTAQAFLSYERARTAPFPHGDLLAHHHIAEEVVYWIRTTADEMISLSHVLRARIHDGGYPQRIVCDSIGPLLAEKDPRLLSTFRRFVPFLTQLNEISNANKHSFLMSDQ